MGFYKTNYPKVLAAWEQNSTDTVALQAKVDAFASRFGGKGLMYSNPARFAGIKFPVPMGRDLWTAPDEHGRQRPRSKPLPKTPKPVKDQIKNLRIEWSENVPTDQVSDDPIYKAMGHGNSLDFIFGGIVLFVVDGCLYAKTGSTEMPKLTEILGSEYQDAYAAHSANRNRG